MTQRIKQKIFQKIHTGHLVYNTCWEDPRCDRALLGLQPDSRVLMLTSAGCNALDYLLDDVQSVVCVDMNPRQNALLELKVALLQHGDHENLVRFFGEGRHAGAAAYFGEVLHERLSPFSQTYWQKNLHYFDGKGLRNSFYWRGSAGTAAFVVKKMLETDPATKKMLQRLFACDNLETQKHLYLRLEPRLLNVFTRWLFNRHIFQSLLGVPQNQQDLAKASYRDGMAGYIRQCFRKVFMELPLSDNYFWKLYFFGAYTPDCCPNYLKKAHFTPLKNRVQRIQTHTGTLSEYLKAHPGDYTHFVLLDHQDWMAANCPDALQEEWELILANSAPGAKILLRSAASKVDFIPDFVHKKVKFLPTAAEAAHQSDRVGTYASVLLGERQPF
jgi:S-adenosylmethionine-diacylglycerol 3-amino-3-carboxypropyl transferase